MKYRFLSLTLFGFAAMTAISCTPEQKKPVSDEAKLEALFKEAFQLNRKLRSTSKKKYLLRDTTTGQHVPVTITVEPEVTPPTPTTSTSKIKPIAGEFTITQGTKALIKIELTNPSTSSKLTINEPNILQLHKVNDKNYKQDSIVLHGDYDAPNNILSWDENSKLIKFDATKLKEKERYNLYFDIYDYNTENHTDANITIRIIK